MTAGQFGQRGTGHFVLAPLLKVAVHRLVVRVGLRKRVPLGAGVGNPQRRFEDILSRNRLAAGAIVGMVLLRKVLPDRFALFARYA